MTEQQPTPELRQLPHALIHEKAVLCTLMHQPERIEEANLPLDLFYLPAHRILLEDITKAKGEWELITAIQRLHDNGLLSAVGGPGEVSDVFTKHPAGRNFDAFVAILRDRMARRMQIRMAAAAADAAYDCSDGSDFLAAISEPVTAIFDAASNTVQTKGMKALAADFIATFEDKVRGKAIEDGIPTGIPEVDRHLHGIKPQHFGIISGRSGDGKSTLATQVFGGISDALYLILERTESSAFARCVVQTARVHHGAVFDPQGFAGLDGRVKPEKGDLMAIRRAVERLTESNLHIVKPSNRRLATICAEIRRHVRLHRVKVVFLDQIGLVRGERIKGDTGEAELRGVSNTIQELAHELGIAIIVLCQVNSEGETKNARAVEEDADWWLSIITERDKKKDNFGEHQHVLIAKDSHHGSTGERLPLILDKATLRFVHGFPKQPEEKKKGRFN